ncbi:Chromosome-anchoring protein RacA [Paraliobacillus sp. PM-2]|uniref:hypothetical protein n=1 Tax=Paraliobacillus sp. PM-2 TaxID=1462524 RepID=UPI00061BE2FC|nr:hypothetical protein [Paraliobacillus sp. PM-2]CQR46657.1 Chromosome-anchoring protein RacA [Paraliobacillus sp. PM-2]
MEINKSISLEHMNAKFEKLYNKIEVIEQRLATKADDVVLTMALNHRQDIERLEKEITHLKSEVEQTNVVNNSKSYTIKPMKNTKKRIKFLPFVQKS